MKKIILSLAITLVSTQTFASSYCYDDGVFAVDKAIRSIERCESNFKVSKLESLRNKLIKTRFNYAKKTMVALQSVKSEYNNVVWTSGNECVKAEYKKLDELQLEVTNSILLCM